MGIQFYISPEETLGIEIGPNFFGVRMKTFPKDVIGDK